MITEGKEIAFKNVVSKYYQFESSDSSEITENFMLSIEEAGLTPNGPMFYSIMSELGAEPIFAMYSIPVEEEQLKDMDDKVLMFQSYFLIRSMLMTRFAVENTEQAQELALEKYAELIEYTKRNNMELTAPFHNLFKIVDEQLYLEIYLGATRFFEDQPQMDSFFDKIKKKFFKGR